MTQREYLPFHKAPESVAEIGDGTHVEIFGQFKQVDDGFQLHVSEIRKLAPGETMHAEDFPSIWIQEHSLK